MKVRKNMTVSTSELDYDSYGKNFLHHKSNTAQTPGILIYESNTFIPLSYICEEKIHVLVY